MKVWWVVDDDCVCQECGRYDDDNGRCPQCGAVIDCDQPFTGVPESVRRAQGGGWARFDR